MAHFLRQYLSFRTIALFMGETLLLVVGIFLAILIRFWGLGYFLENPWLILPKAVLIIAVCQLLFHYFDFYDLEVTNSPVEVSERIIQALGGSSIVLAVIYYSAPQMIIGRGIFLITISIIAVLTFCWWLFIRALFRTKRLTQKVLIVGDGYLAKSVAQEVLKRKDYGYEIIGFVGKNGSRVGESIMNPKIIGTYNQLCEIAVSQAPAKFVVAIDDRREGFPLSELLACKMKGVAIEDYSIFLERLTTKLIVESLNPSHLIFSDGFKKSAAVTTTKRLLETILSFVGLIILFPLMLVVSLLIKIDSPGPVFFKQERVGENGKIFNILKFRSMKHEAENHTGPIWASEDDPRITRVGKYIRKFRIDELPQLWNVLVGNMSFVGPRPERPHFVKGLSQKIPYYNQRHSVRPGVTGWAQIKYSYGASEEDALEKLKYDLYYVKNMSLFFDLFILFETVKIVLFGRGAR